MSKIIFQLSFSARCHHHLNGWFTLDAAVCIFHSGMHQCRDRKFSISLQKRNCLPQMHAENAVMWTGLKRMHVLITTHSFYNISPALVLVFNIFHKIVKAHHLALSLFLSLSLSLSLNVFFFQKDEFWRRKVCFEAPPTKLINRFLSNIYYTKGFTDSLKPYPFHLKSVIIKWFISIHTLS